MDYFIQFSFDEVSTTTRISPARGYGGDRLRVADGLGWRTIRVETPPHPLISHYGELPARRSGCRGFGEYTLDRPTEAGGVTASSLRGDHAQSCHIFIPTHDPLRR